MATNLSGLDKLTKGTAHFIFDVTKDGGTAGTYSIGDKEIPAGALVVSGKMFVETAFVGGTSVSLGVVAAADLASAILTATLVINYAVALTPVDATGTTWIKTTTAGRNLIPVVVGTFTAGRMHVWLDYVIIG